MKKFSFVINGNNYEVDILEFEDNIAHVEVNGTQYNVAVQKELKIVKTPTLVRAEPPQPTRKESKIPRTPSQTTNIAIKAPLPGTIISVLVNPGQKVAMGEKLLTMEAMKMENNVLSEKDGTVRAVNVKPGQKVAQNDVLVEIE
ncbi:MAG: acetyl-CoA carboxylase biotin carboxyl carrier protein subunit [Bacteroidales bacterium]|nr:acetyl-CoA carboxylase biotin carboxyl carrier protein subunit [Bacteroidales bacterium]MDD4602398.1 acetyl-CoA carboxylase biotin carboxyl carrier protein subunit [Bacteroidales bacterium]